jgi:hypothetical protein
MYPHIKESVTREGDPILQDRETHQSIQVSCYRGLPEVQTED